MKKNHKTNILLVVVLLIWGTIGYKIYVRLNPSTAELQSFTIQQTYQKQKLVQAYQYALKPLYRDPFLGTFPKKKKKVVKKKSINKKPKQLKPFPEVMYNGIIEGSSSISYILTVNRKQEILKKGEIHEGVKLIQATRDEAIVQFEKQRKTIQKQ